MSARRNELTRAAARLFAEKGYHGTSIGDLAQALGVQKGSLYAHIESKADLLWEVAREGAAAFHAALDTVPDEGPVVERIRDAVSIARIVNPCATRVGEERLADVREELQRAGELDIILTERPGHATELVTNAVGGGAEAVVVFSGDGGFNEALNGLESDVPIGFLPGGGTSVFSRALGLPRDPIAAARQVGDALAAGRTRR